MTTPADHPDADYFAAPICRNCNAALDGPYCSQCGQRRASRLQFGVVRAEAWQSYRVFEFGLLRAAWRLARAPGHVAREYVMGARTRHIHPLKLLLPAIGVLLLVLTQANHLSSAHAQLSQAMEWVRMYANWSISLGVFAIFIASALVLRWRQPYNLTEHLVLAVYAHFLVVCANLLLWLPALLWHGPAFQAWHQWFRIWPMDTIEAAIVAIVCAQFFRFPWRQRWPQLLLAGLAYGAFKFLLVRLYSLAVIKWVLATLPTAA